MLNITFTVILIHARWGRKAMSYYVRMVVWVRSMENRLGCWGKQWESGRDEGKSTCYNPILKKLLHRVVGFDFRS